MLELGGFLISSSSPQMNTGNSELCNSKCFYNGDRSIASDSKAKKKKKKKKPTKTRNLNKVLYGKKQ